MELLHMLLILQLLHQHLGLVVVLVDMVLQHHLVLIRSLVLEVMVRRVLAAVAAVVDPTFQLMRMVVMVVLV
jgi:hypothetical protein